MLPQEAVEADSIRRLKKVHLKLPEGIGRDISLIQQLQMLGILKG